MDGRCPHTASSLFATLITWQLWVGLNSGQVTSTMQVALVGDGGGEWAGGGGGFG